MHAEEMWATFNAAAPHSAMLDRGAEFRCDIIGAGSTRIYLMWHLLYARNAPASTPPSYPIFLLCFFQSLFHADESVVLYLLLLYQQPESMMTSG